MALVKCKDCGKSVSDSAKACPDCGAKPPERTSIVTKLVAAIIGMGVVMSVIGNIQSSNEQEAKAKAEAARVAALSPEQRATEEKAKAKATQEEADRKVLKEQQWKNTMVAMLMIKKSLRDPDSLQWIQIRANDSGSVVCAEYRARNGFGGMNVGHTPVIASIPVDSPEMWNKNCVKRLAIVEAAVTGFDMVEKAAH
jgi:hypothetical protein